MSFLNKIFPLSELPDRILLTISRSQPSLKMTGRFGHEMQPDKWIFIVGCYNSGTTLLHNVMAQHPDIGGVSTESVELTDALARPEQFGWPRMWHCCLEKMLLEPGPGQEQIAMRIKRQWSVWFPKYKRYIVEKSIANTTRMRFFQEYFKPAYFIHIVRNGYAVAEEIRRCADLQRFKNEHYQGHYPIELCAEQWVASDNIVKQTRPDLKRFLEITYEDLVADQEKTLGQITNFLEIPPVPEHVYKGQVKVHRRNSGIVDMNAAAIKNLTTEDIEKINVVSRTLLEQYGYGIL